MEYHWVKENPGHAVGVLSGLKSLDDYTWGIKRSEMMYQELHRLVSLF